MREDADALSFSKLQSEFDKPWKICNKNEFRPATAISFSIIELN